MASTWGTNTWGSNDWADDVIPVSLTAPAASTTSIGSVTAFNEEGWGRQEWGNSGWGVEYAVGLSGLSATSSVGSLTATQVITVELDAPSALTSSLGSLTLDLTSLVSLTAPSQMTSQLGDFDNAGTLVGWGRNGWGEEPYGDSFNKLVQPAGLSATSSVGAISPADVVGLTGLGSTVSLGSLTITETQLVTITAPSGLTSSVGSIISEITVPLTAPSSLTASVG